MAEPGVHVVSNEPGRAPTSFEPGAVASENTPGVGEANTKFNIGPRERTVPLTDLEAFAACHLKYVDNEVEDLKVLTWRVDNWSSLSGQLKSPLLRCGEHQWKILIYPKGNSSTGKTDFVSLYLDGTDPGNASPDWAICAQFAIVLSNIDDPAVYLVHNGQHRFNLQEPDWGFTYFTDVASLTTPRNGHARPIVENDAVNVSVVVRVVEDTTGVLWHSFWRYDSKKHTGHVGMKNQGATGYINALVQPFFFINGYQKVLYDTPTAGTPKREITLAYQRLLYQLRISQTPVSTIELTHSFGWSSSDIFLARDVQEFNAVFLDKLDNESKIPPAANQSLRSLFAGKMETFIQCTNVNEKSARVEDFHYLGLHVPSLRNLHASFLHYTSIDTLSGEHQYNSAAHGLQDATKGITFVSFPPILILQLRRFRYNPTLQCLTLVQDRFEFPAEMDLGEFVSERTNDPSSSQEGWKYQLHGVIAHCGDLRGGTYTAFVRPSRSRAVSSVRATWLKCDDDRVTPATENQVFEDNFGTMVEGKRGSDGMGEMRFNAAYLLIYIRSSKYGELMREVEDNEIPAHIKD